MKIWLAGLSCWQVIFEPVLCNAEKTLPTQTYPGNGAQQVCERKTRQQMLKAEPKFDFKLSVAFQTGFHFYLTMFEKDSDK